MIMIRVGLSSPALLLLTATITYLLLTYSIPRKCGTTEGGWQARLASRASHALVAGKRPHERRHLILGIPSVYREANYLFTTLSSLIEESDADERKDVIVIVYLADASSVKNLKQLESINNNFSEYIQSGFLQVIMSSADIYPAMDFAATKRTYNDSVERVLWRAKEAIDLTFLFTYAESQAEYFVVLDDDLVASTQYITAIREFIARKNNNKGWVCLEFTGFNSIGLLFRTKDLPKLTRFLWMFYQENPVDWLIRNFINLQVPDPGVIVRRIPSIFRHIGVESSLKNKIQKLTDSTFNMANRKYKNKNHPARLFTTIKACSDSVPEDAYRAAPGFFQGLAKFNDTFDIIFPKPVNTSRIVIISGIVDTNKGLRDTIQDGSLEIGETFREVAPSNSTSTAICDNFRRVKNFYDGMVDLNITQGPFQCVRVRIGHSQELRIVIREIEIFSKVTLAEEGSVNRVNSTSLLTKLNFTS